MRDDDSVDREIDSAWAAFERGDAKAASRLLRELLNGPGLDPGDEAEAHYLLGLAADELGDRQARVHHWLRVLELDAAADPPQRLLPDAEIERLAVAVLDELPQELLDELGNVAVMVTDRPSPDMVADGADPRLLGVFSGLPVPHESVFGRSAGGVIQLYGRNLESEVGTAAELAVQIRVTVIHEVGHFFGASEDDLRRMGLG